MLLSAGIVKTLGSSIVQCAVQVQFMYPYHKFDKDDLLATLPLIEYLVTLEKY